MMKRFVQLIIALPIFSAMLCSCNGEELNEKAVLSINGLADSYQFEAIPDGKVSFTIRTNVNWHLEMEGLDWIKASPGRGLASSSEQTVVLEPIVNEDNQVRKGVMTVVAGDKTRKVTFTQDPASLTPQLEFHEGVIEKTVNGVTTSVFEVDAYNIYGAYFRLSSNCDWEADATDMDEWADVGPLVGKKGSYATISVTPTEPNTSGEDNYGQIVFVYGGDSESQRTDTLILAVCQKKFDPEIEVTESGKNVSSLKAISVGQSFELSVRSNADWSVSSSAAWAIPSVEGGIYCKADKVTVAVEPNETGRKREAKLTFTNAGVTEQIKITQGNEYISVSEATQVLPKEGKSVSLEVESNEKWTAVSSVDWLTLAPISGNGSATISITAAPAPDDNVREATVTITSDSDSRVFKVVPVAQTSIYVDLATPILFNSSSQDWNVENNPDYASEGENGVVSGKGLGVLCSYTYPLNANLYAKVVNPSDYQIKYIIAESGNIAFKNIWTKTAIEFHIPVLNAAEGSVLHFDYGILGTETCPKYWNSEVSLDGGVNWKSFTTGTKEEASNDAAANTVLSGSKKKEMYYNATYKFSKTIRQSEIIIRLICVDGNARNDGGSSTKAGGTVRILGADHKYIDDADKPEVKGPKIYFE